MTRIPGVPPQDGGAFVRLAYRQSRRKLGQLPEPVTVMAHNRKVLTSYGMLESTLERAKAVDPRLKELAWIKAAMEAGCAWCVDYGTSVAPEHGITAEQLGDLPRHRDSDRFSELEKLVLDLAVGMTATPVDVSDELIAALGEHLDHGQVVELVYAIAVENLRARFNWALGIPAQGFADGGACAVPPVAAAAAAAGSSA